MANYLIVGASSGIGKQLAESLSQQGHSVFATYFKKEIKSLASNIQYFPLNVLEADLDLAFLPEVLDGLVYCPGSIVLKPFHRLKSAEFLSDYQLQLEGAVKVMQGALTHLKNSNQASVVLFSTLAVQSGLPFHSLVSASKGAVEGLTRALAAEWAPNIRVNCIAPSLTDTPMAEALLNTEQKREANALRHPLKRIGKSADIAQAAEFLLSDKSSWITGQVMHVDGGLSSLKI